MDMNIEPFAVYDFYLENDPIPKSGVVTDINGDKLLMKVLHGELHGNLVTINVADIIDDSFDKYDTSDQKLYAWHDGE